MYLGGTVTVSVSQAKLGALLAFFSFADLQTKGVDLIDVTDNGQVLTLNAAQANAYASTALKMAGTDKVTIDDYTDAVSGLDVGVIAKFKDKGITPPRCQGVGRHRCRRVRLGP